MTCTGRAERSSVNNSLTYKYICARTNAFVLTGEFSLLEFQREKIETPRTYLLLYCPESLVIQDCGGQQSGIQPVKGVVSMPAYQERDGSSSSKLYFTDTAYKSFNEIYSPVPITFLSSFPMFITFLFLNFKRYLGKL